MVSTPASKRAKDAPKRHKNAGFVEVGPTMVNFGNIGFHTDPQGPQHILITNNSNETVYWKLEAGDQQWLEVEHRRGQIKPHRQHRVKVTARTSSLAVGGYLSTLDFILSHTVSIPVAVTANVYATLLDIQPTTHISPKPPTVSPASSLNLNVEQGSNSGPQQIIIYNPNDAADMFPFTQLNWIASVNPGMPGLHLSRVQGTMAPSGQDQITLTADSGNYSATLSFITFYVPPSGPDILSKTAATLTITVSQV
jgi:Viral BACON domain